MPSGVDEEQTTVDARILNVTVANSGKFFAEIRAVLILYVFDDRIPAFSTMSKLLSIMHNILYLPVLIINHIPISWCVDNV